MYAPGSIGLRVFAAIFCVLLLGAGEARPEESIALARHVNEQRLQATLEKLSEFGRNPEGGVSRLGFSQIELEARIYVIGLMKDAGLEVRVDPAGNIFGLRSGSEQLPTILFGSHIDSVPHGGNFDGPLGSLGAPSRSSARSMTGTSPRATRSKAPGGTLLNSFASDDFDSAMAVFAPVFPLDGQGFCVSPAMGEPEPPLVAPGPAAGPLLIALIGNIKQQAAGLAMNGIQIVAREPAGRASMPHLVRPDERLQKAQKQSHSRDHNDDRYEAARCVF